MGLYDTMQQGLANNPAAPQAAPINGTSAQKSPMGFQQKQQMRANPMMKRPPAQGAAIGAPPVQSGNRPMQMASALGMQPRPNPTVGIQPGMQGGSRDAMQQKMVQLKNAQAPQTIGGSYNELASRYPNLVENRQMGERSGADMSWMDKPGALQMSANPADYNKPEPQGPQSGLSPLQSPYERQIMEQKMAANPGIQMGAVQDAGTSGAAGSLPGMSSLYGTTGRPQVMDRGIGPSDGMAEMFGGQSLQQMQPQQQPVVMDENGLEPRRGPR